MVLFASILEPQFKTLEFLDDKLRHEAFTAFISFTVSVFPELEKQRRSHSQSSQTQYSQTMSQTAQESAQSDMDEQFRGKKNLKTL